MIVIWLVIRNPASKKESSCILLDYSDFKSSVEVPFALSQMGIANAVAIARSNVPRAIAGLKDQGLLWNGKLTSRCITKTKAYFLTDPGMNLAKTHGQVCGNFPLSNSRGWSRLFTQLLVNAMTKLPFRCDRLIIIRYMDDNVVLDARSLSQPI